MEDGAITLWNVKKLLTSSDSQQLMGKGCISAAQIHQGVPVQSLEFNPNKRPSAQQALEDPYFDDIRLPEQERFETPIINLPVDDEGRSDLPMEELRRMIVDEITKLDSDNFDFANDYEEECEDY